MSSKQAIIKSLNRIAEVEGMIMPVLTSALTNQSICPGNESFSGGAKNMMELWEKSYGDKFFKMGTFIRLGSEIESGFRHYYMRHKGYANNQELNADANVSNGVFQRMNGNSSLIKLYIDEVGVNLESLPDFGKVKEFMVARHLYTHRSGLLDDKFITDWKFLTGEDLLKESSVISCGYPENDTYWFRPLGDIWTYQRASVSVFNSLP